jgi:hypothetical protein
VAQTDRSYFGRSVDGATVHGHWVGVVEKPHVGAHILHVLAHGQEHGDRPQATHDAADTECVADRLAEAEAFWYLEVGDGTRLVTANLDHVDGVVSSIKCGPPIRRRRDPGRRLERLADPASHQLRRAEAFGVDVVQHDLGVSQFLVAEDVPEQVAGEDGTAGTEEHCLGHM